MGFLLHRTFWNPRYHLNGSIVYGQAIICGRTYRLTGHYDFFMGAELNPRIDGQSLPRTDWPRESEGRRHNYYVAPIHLYQLAKGNPLSASCTKVASKVEFIWCAINESCCVGWSFPVITFGSHRTGAERGEFLRLSRMIEWGRIPGLNSEGWKLKWNLRQTRRQLSTCECRVVSRQPPQPIWCRLST